MSVLWLSISNGFESIWAAHLTGMLRHFHKLTQCRLFDLQRTENVSQNAWQVPAGLTPSPHPLWCSSKQIHWNLFGGAPACGERHASHALQSGMGSSMSLYSTCTCTSAFGRAREGIAQVTIYYNNLAADVEEGLQHCWAMADRIHTWWPFKAWALIASRHLCTGPTPQCPWYQQAPFER